jgi:hypothetical protein
VTEIDKNRRNSLCIVAIARDELPFIDEWLAYHRILGVEHFYLYDDDSRHPLKNFLKPHERYVTTIEWHECNHGARAERRLDAYRDGLTRAQDRHNWVAFIDVDEFITLTRHHTVCDFLDEFRKHGQVSLNKHLFGNNGFYSDPLALITECLVRRQSRPSNAFKSIVRTDAIAEIPSAAACILKPGFAHVDPNKKPFSDVVYPEKTEGAYIAHYICRSFERWMGRRSAAPLDDEESTAPALDLSQPGQEDRLRRFVEVITRDGNEISDKSMRRYKTQIDQHLRHIGITSRAMRISRKLPRTGGVSNRAIVVYTAISNGYDELQSQIVEECDHVAFLEPKREFNEWQAQPLESRFGDPNRDAKIYKVLSHVYFPDKEFSLWIDGCVRLHVPTKELIDRYMKDFDLLVHRHPVRKCIFEEARRCREFGLDDSATIDAQMQRYQADGYPANAGLHENRIILRRHNDRVRLFNELWWEEIQKGSRRDQLSSPYVAKRVGLKVGYFPGSTRSDRSNYNGFFSVLPHMGRREIAV